MTSVPRSQALIRFASSTAGYTPAWRSPTGYVTLVKALAAANNGPAEARFDLVFFTSDGQLSLAVARLTAAAGTVASWQGWAVLNPNDYCAVYSSQGSYVVWVSGAVLAGPNQFPPATREVVAELPSVPLPDVPIVTPQQ